MAAAVLLMLLVWARTGNADTTCTNDEDGNWCYVCHVTPFSNECMFKPGVLRDSRREVERILKNNGSIAEAKQVGNVGYCPKEQPYCTIEEIIIEDKLKLFYRDCSDGKRFSFAINGTRLDHPDSDNITHCAYLLDLRGEVCITMCGGKFCNGPHSPASTIVLDVISVFFFFVAIILAKMAL